MFPFFIKKINMYSLQDVDISLEEFNQYISDEDIYDHYLGDFQDNSWFSAPWRNDSNPSLRISFYKSKWVWTDFGEDPRPQGGLDFVMRYYNVNLHKAIQQAWQDIVIGQNHTSIQKKNIIKHNNRSYCCIRALEDIELNYWRRASITEMDLIRFSVYAGYIRHNGILWHKSIDKDPLFIYMWDKWNYIYKGYRPYATDSKSKFYAHNISNHIQGYDLLPQKGKILIITKSYKDVIVWYKLGYPAIAPHSENMFIHPAILEELKLRFDYIYINYDNDETGIKKSIEYSSKYGLHYFNLPESTNAKDPFQFVTQPKNEMYRELNNLFTQKLERDLIII